MVEQKREQLLALNRCYGEELKAACPELCDEKHTAPYYIDIPDHWFDPSAKYRILVVGKEGYNPKIDGTTPVERAIQEMMAFNKEYPGGEGMGNRSPFWRRFRRIMALGYPCAWSNMDKIHLQQLRSGKYYSMGTRERRRLHSVKTRVLHEEIDILRPTHVVFFGWYDISLAHECPEVLRLLYDRDVSEWKMNVCLITYGDVKYLFTYHPGWGSRRAGYEDRVLEVLKSTLPE